ncbi:MAG: hypothetical protein KAU20_03110, partial [Nanoarchaeota archaeon]|nr:hypothetical protein [Nanoarchaeota archaeon]
MKLKKAIKRIVALSTGATMLGATVLGAMAADLSEYPSPLFIKDGKFDGLIVIGADADTQDMLGAMDIISTLQATAVSGSTGTAATTETVGDVYKFEKATDRLNLGEAMSSIRSKLYDNHLPIILADGTFSTSKGAKYDYEQELNMSATAKLTHFADKDYEDDKPVIGIRIDRNDPVLLYTLEFTKAAKSTVDSSDNWDEFEDRQIEILGEVFDIFGSDDSDKELELMRGALKPTLEEGETATYTINGVEYEVTALIIQDTGDEKVKMKVNGEVTDSLDEGDIYELADGTLIGIREVLPNEAGDVTQDMVEFYMGAKKITLTNGEELEMDDEDISNVDVVITTGSSSNKTTIEKIEFSWIADDDLFITEEANEVVMPGLESIKFYMEGFYKGAEELIKAYASGDDTIVLDAPLKDYDVKLDLLYAADSSNYFNFTGGSATKQLITTVCNNNFTVDMDTDEFFVVTKKSGKEAETAVLQLSKVHATNGVTIKDYTGTVIAENKKLDKTFDAADMTITVKNFSNSDSNASFEITDSTCQDRMLITAEGLQILLPGNGASLVEATYNHSFLINITEEDKDENIGSGSGFYQLNATFNSDSEAHVRLFAKTNLSNDKTYSIDDTKVYVGYVESQVSSKVTEDKTADQYDIEIVYPGEETYANLYIGSKASKVTTTAAAESVVTAQIEVGAAVMDTSLTSYTDKNLIVIGGPAINRAAAALLGKTYPA